MGGGGARILCSMGDEGAIGLAFVTAHGTETRSALSGKPLSAILPTSVTHFKAFYCLPVSDTAWPAMKSLLNPTQDASDQRTRD